MGKQKLPKRKPLPDKGKKLPSKKQSVLLVMENGSERTIKFTSSMGVNATMNPKGLLTVTIPEGNNIRAYICDVKEMFDGDFRKKSQTTLG